MAQALNDLLVHASDANRDAGGTTSVDANAEVRVVLSQPLTKVDRSRGQIRFPKSAKRLFPVRRAEIRVWLRGVEVRGQWDPRVGGDRERSGVLRVGREVLERLLEADVRLVVTSPVHLD